MRSMIKSTEVFRTITKKRLMMIMIAMVVVLILLPVVIRIKYTQRTNALTPKIDRAFPSVGSI